MPAVLLSLLFNALWFLSVAGGNAGALLCLPLVIYLLCLYPRSLRIFMLFFAGIGLSFDGLLFLSGQMHSTDFPLWLGVLWLIFFSLMPACLQPLKIPSFVLAVIGAISGPMAYYAGSQLGDLQLHMPAYIALSFFWAFFLPYSVEHYEKLCMAATAVPQFFIQTTGPHLRPCFLV